MMRGGCLCGAVRFEAEPAERHCHACHCEMCRRWTGSTFLAVPVAPDAIRFEGADGIQSYASSDWAERAFCAACGSTLFYRLTGEGPQHGMRYVALGLFDTPDGFSLESELFIDTKPDGYAFAGAHKRTTRAEFFAMIEGDAAGDPA